MSLSLEEEVFDFRPDLGDLDLSRCFLEEEDDLCFGDSDLSRLLDLELSRVFLDFSAPGDLDRSRSFLDFDLSPLLDFDRSRSLGESECSRLLDFDLDLDLECSPSLLSLGELDLSLSLGELDRSLLDFGDSDLSRLAFGELDRSLTFIFLPSTSLIFRGVLLLRCFFSFFSFLMFSLLDDDRRLLFVSFAASPILII